eukprot:COSAG06_NODE_49051_length_328_cov_0.615721_1_plen_34_part_01
MEQRHHSLLMNNDLPLVDLDCKLGRRPGAGFGSI